jgi:hypothetical protein
MDNDKHIEVNDKMEESSPKKRGRPAHLPTDDTRKEVYELSKVGTRYEDIAEVLSISDDTLVKHYKKELKLGRIQANAVVAGTLYEKAKNGDTSSMIFWLKSRAQWKETQKHEVNGDPDGEPVQVKVITGID